MMYVKVVTNSSAWTAQHSVFFSRYFDTEGTDPIYCTENVQSTTTESIYSHSELYILIRCSSRKSSIIVSFYQFITAHRNNKKGEIEENEFYNLKLITWLCSLSCNLRDEKKLELIVSCIYEKSLGFDPTLKGTRVRYSSQCAAELALGV